MINQISTIFCALFLAQVLVIHAKPEPNDLQASEVRGIADEAEAAFKALMAAVDKAVDEATGTVNAAVGAVNETIMGFQGKAHDAINLAMDPINDNMKEIMAKAEMMGFNTTDCEIYIDDLTDLPNKLQDDMVECMTDELYQAIGYANDCLATMKETEQEMANFTDKIKDCDGNFVVKSTCLTLLVGQMATKTVEVPIKIAADVAKTGAMIGELIPKVGLCYTKSLAQVPIQGAEIVANFAFCVGT